MSETKFTPGPWNYRLSDKRYEIGIGLVEGPNGYDVAESYADDCDPDVALANARLIAAAPDMYEALEQLLDDMGADGLSVCQEAKEQALAALAKARGQS